MRPPKVWRWARAKLAKRFWLPCHLCGKMFGGNERGTGRLLLGPGHGVIVCPCCKDEAHKANALHPDWFTPRLGPFVLTPGQSLVIPIRLGVPPDDDQTRH